MSTTTGPVRPVRAISNAARKVASSLLGSVIRNTCLAQADMMLNTGASWNASVPMEVRGTWPQISTTSLIRRCDVSRWLSLKRNTASSVGRIAPPL